MMKKIYVRPETVCVHVQAESAILKLSGIHPDGPGSEDIFGGDGNGTGHPLDAKGHPDWGLEDGGSLFED